MAYIKHNPGEGKNYGHSVFEEEKEKKEKEEEYQRNQKYAAEGENKEKLYNAAPGDEKDVSQDYLKTKKADDKKEDENKESIESTIKQELPGEKYKKEDKADEAEIQKKAAAEIGIESPKQAVSRSRKSKHKSIEEAISKAVKEEKEVIHME